MSWLTQVFGYKVAAVFVRQPGMPRYLGRAATPLAAASNSLNLTGVSEAMDRISVRKTGHVDRALAKSLLKLRAFNSSVLGVYFRASGKLA